MPPKKRTARRNRSFRARGERHGNAKLTAEQVRAIRRDRAAHDTAFRVLAERYGISVSTVGRLLRRTALDELPEMVNILKREMSFVGPRALDVEEQRSLEEQIPGFEQRLQVAPGLTGLAQVHNHGDGAYDKFRYDLSYLDRMGPWLDAKLLLLSVRNTLGARWDQRRGKPTELDGSTTRSSEDEAGGGRSGAQHRKGHGND